MKFYHVMTSSKERHAQPASIYLVAGNSENHAISRCYEQIQDGKLLPMKRLGKYSIPDYTCAVLIN